MKRIDALEAVQSVLGQIKQYAEDHHTFEDIASLNEKYLPAAVQDEVTWVSEMVQRLLDADPTEPDHDEAVTVPPVPAR